MYMGVQTFVYTSDACDVVRFTKMLTRFGIDFICNLHTRDTAKRTLTGFYIMKVLFTETTPEIRGIAEAGLFPEWGSSFE